MVGNIVVHYKIIEKLGCGGMGEVYKAEDTVLKRTVALKFLPSSVSNDEASRKRFLREAVSASALDHPNICTIYETGQTEDGRLFISMACYEGETLKEKINRGPLGIEESLDILLQVSKGLKEAHKNKIIHRDIKPSNIFITKDGLVKILDFGLAKVKGQTQVTLTESTAGTINYMSPEQARGEEVDQRTDIWSLGIVMYEMLTGMLPFKSEYDQAVIYSILNENPDLGEIPKKLKPVLEKSIAKDPGERYMDVDELIKDIHAFKNNLTLQSIPSFLKSSYKLKSKTAIIFTSIFLISSAFIALYFINGTGNKKEKTVSNSEMIMIVVLPFENRGVPEDKFLADGIRDEISNKLSSLSSIGVISRNSAEQYANSNKTTKEIGEELGVDYILESTIRWVKRGNKNSSRIRIITQLVRVSDDVIVGSETYDKVIGDIFDLQNEIAENVVEKIGVKIRPGQSVTSPASTKNLEALDYYTKAVQFQSKNSTGPDLLTSIRLYQKAIELDSNFAEAYIMASIAYEAIYVFLVDRNKNNLEKARIYLQKGKKLKPGMALIHLANAFHYIWIVDDYLMAMEEFKKTIEIQPSNAEAHFWIGMIYSDYMEKFDLGLKYKLTASKLDPFVTRYIGGLGGAYFITRKYKKAEKYFKKAIELNPEIGSYHIRLAYNYLVWKGDISKAEEIINTFKEDYYTEGDLNLFIYLSILKRNFNKALIQLKSSKIPYSNNYTYGYWYIPNSQMIALIYRYKNEPELSRQYFKSSIAEINEMLKKDPEDLRLYASLSVSYAGLGDENKVLTEYSKYWGIKKEDLKIKTGIVKKRYPEKFWILLGNYDRALSTIDSMLSHPTRFSVNILKLDPLYDPLRNLQGYKKIIEKYPVEKSE